jgi:hypothetical protein
MKTVKNAKPIVLIQHAPPNNAPKATTTSAHPMRNDPILQELWEIKAEINKEANYDAATLLRYAQIAVNDLHQVSATPKQF